MMQELEMDWNFVSNYLITRLREYIQASGKKGGVIGLSGGIDSSVVLKLLTQATRNVHVLLMPSESTPAKDIQDSYTMLRSVGAPYSEIKIDDLVKSFSSKVDSDDKVLVGNIKARVRMTLLYAYAQKLDYLVIGTGDKSEILLGYFTKYGDGGVDVLPIGDLYKTQVKKLAQQIGIPKNIIEKPSSPALWEGQTAEGELGIDYESVDKILYLLYEKFMDPQKVAQEVKTSRENVDKVIRLVRNNEHKRKMPEIFKISGRL